MKEWLWSLICKISKHETAAVKPGRWGSSGLWRWRRSAPALSDTGPEWPGRHSHGTQRNRLDTHMKPEVTKNKPWKTTVGWIHSWWKEKMNCSVDSRILVNAFNAIPMHKYYISLLECKKSVHIFSLKICKHRSEGDILTFKKKMNMGNLWAKIWNHEMNWSHILK